MRSNTLRTVICVILLAVMSSMLFACGETPDNGASWQVIPGTSDETSQGASSGTGDSGSKPEVFNPDDYETFTCAIEEDDTDWWDYEGYDIIIQAGQSNAEGNGFGELSTTAPFVPRDEICYYVDSTHNDNYTNVGSQPFKVVRAEERSYARLGYRNEFALSFAREYLNSGFLPEGRKILIVRTAIGATGFTKTGDGAHPNNPNWNWLLNDPDAVLYPRMINAVTDALQLTYGTSAKYKNRLVAFLWHQGENDAIARMNENTYYNHLKGLVNGVRTTFECPKLPFICGDFVHDWKKSAVGTENACNTIIKAQKRVCAGAAPAAFIPTEGLKSNKQDPTHPLNSDYVVDNIHFCREAINLLGKKYFDAYKALILAGYSD